MEGKKNNTFLDGLSRKKFDPKDRITELITKAKKVYEEVVEDNHGIKEENIASLFVPLGVGYSDIDQTLINNLSSFGEERGKIAHHSCAQTTPNPVDKRNSVRYILQDLKRFDGAIEDYMNSIQGYTNPS